MKPVSLTNFSDQPAMVQLPDGRLGAFFGLPPDGADPVTARYAAERVAVRFSSDDGRTWTQSQPLSFTVPPEAGGWFREGLEAIVDGAGEVHLFFLCDANTGIVPSTQKKVAIPGEDQRPKVGEIQARLDIWHLRSANQRTHWPSPKPIWTGYTGSLNSATILRSGRILIPFSYLTKRNWAGDRGEGIWTFSFPGQFDCTVVYSDDQGTTWQTSSAALKIAVPDIVSAYGAVEPVVVELKDGRIWMLIRTQNGRFYESFSADGADWSEPQPTNILSSDSPAGLVGLDDGRIVLFWNNCLRFPYAYGGRHVLHAAISEDSGQSWRGYREVSRDPVRNAPPPPQGDHGVGYPYPTLVRDGKIIISTGLGPSKDIARLIDPAWLSETRQKADFVHEQDEWHTFGTKGVEFLPHPDKKRRRVLSIQKTDRSWPAAAVWNFPAGFRGQIKLKLFAKPGFGGSLLGLTDHFSVPFDGEDRCYNLFNIRIGPGGIECPTARWFVLKLRWDCIKRRSSVSIDGKRVAWFTQTRESSSGPCYLRLSSTAKGEQDEGYIIESVQADVASPAAAQAW